MPIYEYRCDRCKRQFSELFLNTQDVARAKCKFCRSKRITRLLSSFSIHQTEADRLGSLDMSKEPSEGFYSDSRNIGLRTKKRLKELGVDLGPKLDEIVERGRTGKILDDNS
jgi:putative FmdB family regulatory protein